MSGSLGVTSWDMTQLANQTQLTTQLKGTDNELFSLIMHSGFAAKENRSGPMCAFAYESIANLSNQTLNENKILELYGSFKLNLFIQTLLTNI